MSYKKQELFTLCEHLGSLMGFGGVHVAHRFRFCFVFFVFIFLLCLAGVSGFAMLDCPFGFLYRLFFRYTKRFLLDVYTYFSLISIYYNLYYICYWWYKYIMYISKNILWITPGYHCIDSAIKWGTVIRCIQISLKIPKG